MRGSKARLVITAIVAASRFPFPRLYRSPGNPIGKSIDYLDFATIELPGPAYERYRKALAERLRERSDNAILAGEFSAAASGPETDGGKPLSDSPNSKRS